MEDAAAVRKARIDALRRVKQAEKAGDWDAVRADAAGQAVKRAFRSYQPTITPVAAAPPADTVEQDVAGIEQDVIARDAALQQEELDLTNIAPRRPNWDLHRDLEARLQRVQRRNKEAILTLIRKRVGAEQSVQDVAATMGDGPDAADEAGDPEAGADDE